MHCSFFTITNSGLTSNTWSNVITSVFTEPESECNSNRLGYSLAYLVCHADANGPPNFLIYPWSIQSDSNKKQITNILISSM